MPNKLQNQYREILTDHFPSTMSVTFGRGSQKQLLSYEKVTWKIGEKIKGLRYGENPGQEAALYRLTNGNLTIGNVQTIKPGKYLASNVELLQSGKHPGKINITDTDNALNILRYFTDTPAAAIIKHGNPCGVALGKNLLEAYQKANLADRLAAFGGAIALNREVDKKTAQAISENYSEVVVAPEFAPGAMDIFSQKKNLRVMKIGNIARLQQWVGEMVVDLKSLIDGGLILQTSYVPKAKTLDDIRSLPLGYHEFEGKKYQINRKPTRQEYKDMWFGWLVESGITSNSVIYVKDGVTIGIGTGEQDRVGVAKIARDKAYEKLKDRLCFEKYGFPYNQLLLDIEKKKTVALFKKQQMEPHGKCRGPKVTPLWGKHPVPEDQFTHGQVHGTLGTGIDEEVNKLHGGLKDATMVSDAFFPFRDGIDVGLKEGIKAVIQPGGSLRDHKSIEACNKVDATMIFTGQRSFKH